MKRLFCTVAMAAAMAGCGTISSFGGYQFAPGAPRQQVLERMGQPHRVVSLPGGGERLQYSLQPVGQYAWMVDVDAQGRVVQSRQVLTAENFHRIENGKWTREDVEREFGRPAWVDSVTSWNGPIMTYRWRDNQGSDMFYWVYLDPRGVVQRAHPGMEFVSAPNDRS